MRRISLLNSVLGPVTRGPSSSHTAAPYFIAKTARELSLSNGETLVEATVRFDKRGSLAFVYASQYTDEALAAGLCGYDMDSPAYLGVLHELERKAPFEFNIEIGYLSHNFHPNRMDLILRCSQADNRIREDTYQTVSIGGGLFTIFSLNGHQTSMSGETGELVIEGNRIDTNRLIKALGEFEGLLIDPPSSCRLPVKLKTRRLLSMVERNTLAAILGIELMREASQRQLLMTSQSPSFFSADEVMSMSHELLLHEIAEHYESRMLGLPTLRVRELFQERLRTMFHSIHQGFEIDEHFTTMKYIEPSAAKLAKNKNLLNIAGGPLHDAICGSLAIMELNISRGIICAAPTGGSAGIIPGCFYALEKQGFREDEIVYALEVAALVGVLIAMRGTFAAECCGCTAETGAASAMAAGGIAYLHGAVPSAVFDAASLCLMNTMGLVCDPINGEMEIPCHAHNVAGIGHAYTAAMSVVGGFKAGLPLEEVVDTMIHVGKKMCPELKCTAKGGLAVTPTALKMKTEEHK